MGGVRSAEHVVELVKKHDLKLRTEKIETLKKRNRKRIKKGKSPKELVINSNDGFITDVLGPILYDLPIEKPKTRDVFSFPGIQSSCGVTYLRSTDTFYNNVYP